MNSTTFKNLEVGKKYERKVQNLLDTHSAGQVYRNVRVGSFCEFDAVVEDYPLLTFIEIKRYRADFTPYRVRTAMNKFREHCTRIVDTGRRFDMTWYPHHNKWDQKEDMEVTLFELLLNKIDIKPVEGWRFRMMLIIPNAVYSKVVDSLYGYNQPSNVRNLIEVDGVPLIVIRESAIKATFS